MNILLRVNLISYTGFCYAYLLILSDTLKTTKHNYRVMYKNCRLLIASFPSYTNNFIDIVNHMDMKLELKPVCNY